MLSLIVGIISSLIATALFIGFSEIVRKILIPWYADKIYRGVRIDGDWEAIAIQGEAKPQEIEIGFHLNQAGDQITGTYAHKAAESRRDIYKVSGVIQDGYFLAYATPVSNRHMDGISMLLHVQTKKDDLLMAGAVLCFSKPGEVKAMEDLTFRLVGG